MLSAENKKPFFQNLLKQLECERINITNQTRFQEFWVRLLQQKVINQSLSEAISEFVQENDIPTFKKLTLQQLQIMLTDDHVAGNGSSNEQVFQGGNKTKRKSQKVMIKEQFLDQKKGFFWYEQEYVPKNVLFIAFTQQSIEKMKLENKQQSGDLKGAQYRVIEKGLCAFAFFAPLNFKTLPLENYHISLEIKAKGLFSFKQNKQFTQLDKKVTYHKAKGVIIMEDVTKKQNLNGFKKKFILKAAEFMFKNIHSDQNFKNQKEKWNQLKPWWYMFKNLYASIEIDIETEKQLISTILLNGNEDSFLRYYIWLLLAIHIDNGRLQMLFQSPLFQRLRISPDYKYPEWGGEQEKILETQYLMCFISQKNEFKNADAVKFNLTHQSQEQQRQIILSMEPKYVEKLLGLIQAKLVQNNLIKVSEFIVFYFDFMINQRDLQKNQGDKREIIIKCFQLLRRKCLKIKQSQLMQKFDFQVEESLRCNNCFYKLVYEEQRSLQTSRSVPTQFWAQVFQIIAQIHTLSRQIAKEIIKTFSMDKKKMITAIQNNFKPILLSVCKMENPAISQIFTDCLFSSTKASKIIKNFICSEDCENISTFVIFFLEFCNKQKYFQSYRNTIKISLQQINKIEYQQQFVAMIKMLEFDFAAPPAQPAQSAQAVSSTQAAQKPPPPQSAPPTQRNNSQQINFNQQAKQRPIVQSNRRQSQISDPAKKQKGNSALVKLQQVTKEKVLPNKLSFIRTEKISNLKLDNSHIKLLVVVFSDSAFVKIYANRYNSKQIVGKNFQKVYQDTTFSYFYCQRVDLSILEEEKAFAVADKQQLVLTKQYLDYDEAMGVFWHQYQDIRLNELTYFQFWLIYHLSLQTQQLNSLEEMRKWLKFIFKKLQIPTLVMFLQQANKFAAQVQKNSINLSFYYSFVCIINMFFKDQSSQVLQKCQLSKKVLYHKLNSYRLPLNIHESNEEVTELNFFKTVFKSMIDFLKKQTISINLSIKVVTDFFKKGLEYKRQLLGKELISIIIEKSFSKIFVDADRQLTIFCKTKTIFSLKELFLIKCFYMKEILYKDSVQMSFNAQVSRIKTYFISLFSLLKEKKKQITNHSFRSIVLDQQEMMQNIEDILKPKPLHSDYSQSEQRSFIFKSASHFIPFYTALKKIADTYIFDSIYRLIKKQINQLVVNSLNVDKQFFETMKILLSSPIKHSQKEMIQQFTEKYCFSAQKLYGLLDIYCIYSKIKLNTQQQEVQEFQMTKMEQKDYIKALIIKFVKMNPEVTYYGSNFLKKMQNLIKQVKKGRAFQEFFNLFEQVISFIIMNESTYLSYMRQIFSLTDFDLKMIYVNHICQQFYRQHKSQAQNNQLFYEKLQEAYKIMNSKKQKDQLIQTFVNVYNNSVQQKMYNEQENFENFWQYFLRKPQLVKYLLMKFKDQKENILKQLNSRFQNRDLTSEQTQLIRQNYERYPPQIQEALPLNAVKEFSQYIQMMFAAIKNLATIFQSFKQLQRQSIQLNELISKFKVQKVRSMQSYLKKYGDFYNQSKQIKILMQNREFNQQNVNDYASLTQQYQRTKNNLLRKIKNAQKLSVKQFIDTFTSDSIFEIFENHQQFDQILFEVKRISQLINRDKLNLMFETVSALQYIIKALFPEENVEEEQRMKKILKDALDILSEKMQANITISEFYKHISEIKNTLEKSYGNWQKQAKFMLLRSILKHQQLFKAMQALNLNRQKLKNLQDYNNEIQNSFAKADIIRQFRQVFEFWSKIQQKTKEIKSSKARNLKNLMDIIDLLMKYKNFGDITKCIENCWTSKALLLQKLQQSSDLTTSFKFEVLKILSSSIFVISQSSNQLDFKILIYNGEENTEFSFNKLSLYKEKSMLLFQSNQNTEAFQQILQFRQFCELVKEIQKIKEQCIELQSYGYDPKLLVVQIPIKSQKSRDDKIISVQYEKIKYRKQYLFQLKDAWVADIRQICSQSFILTHFIGTNLASFVNTIVNGQVPKIVSSILLSTEEFEKAKQRQQNQSILQTLAKGNVEPIQKVKFVKRLFEEFDQKYKFDEERQKNPIHLITSRKENFYAHILRENNNNIPLPNQIFFCHQNTVSQQLQFFLYRALINYNNNHYIIGVHKLPQKVKHQFCTLLSELKRYKKNQFNHARLFFIDNDDINTVYIYLCKPNSFTIAKKLNYQNSLQEELEKCNERLSRLITQTQIISSTKAGLGKTHHAQTYANSKKLKIHHFPIGGNIDFNSLGKRLKEIDFTGEQILLIKIGSVQQKQKLQIFLASLIILRCFFSQEYIYLNINTGIFIELENIYVPSEAKEASKPQFSFIDQKYYILNILAKYNFHTRIQRFDSASIDFNNNSKEEEFVFKCLHLFQTKQINNINIFSENLLPQQYLEAPLKLQLIQKYFVRDIRSKRLEPTYLLYTHVMKLLFNMFDTFTKSPFFTPELLEIQNNQNPLASFNFKQYRYNFVDACIKNSLKLLQETLNENKFHQSKQSRQKTFRQISKECQMLIIPDYMKQSYRFVYFKDESVPFTIKVFNIIQGFDTFKLIRYGTSREQFNRVFSQQCSMNRKSDEQVQNIMHDILKATTNDQRYQSLQFKSQMNKQFFQNYALTRDNFFKMCMIVQRERSKIPCIIQGQSGVGKTALINYLSQNFYKIKPLIFNIHAGIHQKQIAEMVKKIIEESNKLSQQTSFMMDERLASQKKVFVFFDQFNTTDELSYLKQIIIQHRFMGKKLPDNVYFIAACNPYRFKIIGKKMSAGLMHRHSDRNSKQMAFKVNPPPLSMIQLMWDYQQLTLEENRLYMQKILKKMQYPNKAALIEVILMMHQEIKDKIEISAVSLRDVERFSQLYEWLNTYLSKLKNLKTQVVTRHQTPLSQKSAALTLHFCYCLRFSSEDQRREYMNKIQHQLMWQKGFISKIVNQEQTYFVQNLIEKQKNIAENLALKENIFTTFVCVMNKIPILIIGSPGSSKSLSVNILASNLMGGGSKKQICREYPQINMIYFQGSQSSTSKGIEQVFSKAERSAKDQNNCIYFDEIGLAEKSPHNPLKVLHSKLQIHGQRLVSFIGISNYELDAAKMSRFLILNRSPPSKTQLGQTAKAIYYSYVGKKTFDKVFKAIQRMGDTYHQFIKKWQSGNNNKKGFFGLRDFYNYVKHVCKRIKANDYTDIHQLIQKSIKVNFDGQRNSLRQFNQCFIQQYDLKKTAISDKQRQIDPIKLVQQNLEDRNSRCLLLIVKGQALLPIIQNHLKQKGIKITMICGSVFSDDEKSEEYNLQVTQKVISLMNKGEIAAFKDINNSIQSSLYDLFNKSYNNFGNKTYCRIAVGANSNPQCPVHPKFNAIVFMEESKARNLDLPFLNRFQKHYLQTQSILDGNEKKLCESIKKWINEQLLSRKILKNSVLPKQNYLFNISEESIITLVLKYRNIRSFEARQMRIKYAIKQNGTLDFMLLFSRQNQQNKHLIDELYQINSDESSQQDQIIYTYDQYIDLNQSRQASIFGQSKKIRLSQMKSEKQLKQELAKHLIPQYSQKCIVVIECSKLIQASLKRRRQEHRNKNLQQQKRHILLIQQILFLVKKIKQQLGSKNQIIIIVQLQRSTFFKHKQFKINISYLHEFSQRFVEKFQIDPNQLLYNIRSFQDLYQWLQLPKNLRSLYNRAALSMKIKTNDPTLDTKQIFHQIINLDRNQVFMSLVSLFLGRCLQNHEFDASLLHRDQQLLNLCSDTYQALQKLTSNIASKYIFMFIAIMTSGNYYRLFEDQNEMQQENASRRRQRQKFIKHDYFRAELERKIKQISSKQLSQQVQKIRLLNESNQIIFSSNQVLLKETRQFVENLIKKNNRKYIQIDIEETTQVKLDSKYSRFKSFLAEELKQFPRINEIFRTEDQSTLIIRDIITLKFNEKASTQINFIVDLFEQKVKAQQSMKLFCLIGQPNKLIDFSFEVLFILLRYNKNFSQMMNFVEETTFLRQQSTLQEQGTYFLTLAMKLAMQMVKLSRQNVEMFKGANNFYLFFKQLNDKITKQWNNISEHFQIPSQYFLLKGFYQLFQTFGGQSKEQTLAQFINFQYQSSLYQRIFHFVTRALEESPQLRQRYQSFLSCSFFENWASDCLKNQSHSNELGNCIRTFVDWSNKSLIFANKSLRFLSQILPFSDQQSKIKQILRAIRKSKPTAVIDTILAQNVVFQLALNNYFCKKIIEMFYQVRRNKNYKRNLLQQYYQDFSRIINSDIAQCNTQNNFNIAFLKVYLNEYLRQLLAGSMQEITQRIDRTLQEDGRTAAHARMYLSKKIISTQTLEEIKNNFFDCNRCEWIKYEKYILEQRQSIRKVNFIESNLLKNQIQRFQNSQLSQTDFKRLISKGLTNSQSIYELLNFFLHRICYTLEHQKRKKLIALIQKSEQLQFEDVEIIKQLLLSYAKGQIIKHLRNGKKSLQQCYQTQIHLCNYLNVIVATQKEKNPLAEMFFQNSQVPASLSKYLKNKFCIGNIPHPGVARLSFFLKRHQNNFKAASYIKCSADCDFFVPVGGNFYGINDNCRNPIDVRLCPYCKNQIGGTNHYKLQLRPDNIHIQPVKLQEQRKKLSATTYSFTSQNSKRLKQDLTGLVRCQSATALKNHFKRKAELIDMINQGFQSQVTLAHQYILQSAIYFTYLFLLEKELIDPNQIQRSFGISAKDCFKLFPEFIDCCQEQIEKELKIRHEDLPFWSIAAGQRIFSQILIFSNSKDPKTYKGLSSSLERDLFQQQIKKALLKISYNRVEMEKAIVEKMVVSQVNIGQILKERAEYSTIQSQYRYIRLFKNMTDIGRDSGQFDEAIYKYMKECYSICIKNDYPLLNYFLQAYQKDKKVNTLQLIKNIKAILTFLTKVKKLCSFKLKRHNKKDTKLIDFIKSQLKSKEQSQKLLKQFRDYIKLWNSMRRNKQIYNLQFDCHFYQDIPEITEDEYLNMFLPIENQKQFNNEKAQKLTAFISSLAVIYNQIVKNLTLNIKRVVPNSILCQDRQESLDPTEITAESRLLQLPKQQYLKSLTSHFSNYSVKYGVSNLQFFFDDIEFALIKNMRSFCLLKQKREQFRYPQFIGDNSHFLVQIKQRNDNITLKEINKLTLIEDYFKDRRHGKSDTFHKFVNEVQKCLEIILIYYKNANSTDTSFNLFDFVEKNRIPNILKQLKEDPFKKLPLKILVDLYQYVQSLSFENIDKLLAKSYRGTKLKNHQALDHIIELMKKQKRPAGLPSYQNFKNALYRFVSRKILPETLTSNQKIIDHLCQHEYYWNKDEETGKYIENFYEDFKYAMDIPLENLELLLRKVPFAEETSQIADESISTKKINKKFM